jgi:hypothetical protein
MMILQIIIVLVCAIMFYCAVIVYKIVADDLSFPTVVLYQKDGYIILDIDTLSLDRLMFSKIGINSRINMVFTLKSDMYKRDIGENLTKFDFEKLYPDLVYLDKIPNVKKHKFYQNKSFDWTPKGVIK